MKLPRFLVSMTLLVILFGSAAPASALFTDLSYSDPSYDALLELQEQGVIEGYADGTFKSRNNINRAEFMKVLVGTVDSDPSGENCFKDVQNQWYAPYVCTAKDRGWVQGYEDGLFRPGNEINFAEASQVIARAFELDEHTLASDDPWFRATVQPIADRSAIPLSISDFDKSIARGEMAEVIWRLDTENRELPSLTYEELVGLPVSVASCSMLIDEYLVNNRDTWGEGDYLDEPSIFTPADLGTSNNAVAESEGSAAPEAPSVEFSTTNIQEVGVDEADIVKNNGSHLFMVDGDQVRILQIYPVAEMQEVASLSFQGGDFSPQNLYLDGDQLIVIAQGYYDPMGRTHTGYYQYDMSNPASPVLDRSMLIDGRTTSSRKVDDTVYLITSQNGYSYPTYESTEPIASYLPNYYDSLYGAKDSLMAGCTDIKMIPHERDFNYVMASAIPLDGGEADFEVLMGESEEVYASRDNLYVSATNYNSADFYYDYRNAKTILMRFALDDGSIEFEASGKVPGTLLDQFSMSESDGHLRVATNEGGVNDDSQNNLFVLDSRLDIVGSIEGLAPGERIYSSRLIGDRGYIVTFKKVDPLYVLDLSNPTNPYVLGELKIPGYSEYLHPFGDDYLIGFGKDAEDAAEEQEAARNLDFAWYQGLKVSLFDITDVENPRQVDSYAIGDRGSNSPLLYDHKAFLLNEAEGWMAFPALVAEHENPEEASASDLGRPVYQGLYVLNIDENDGFSLRGRVTHFDDETYSYDLEWHDERINRSLYIGDHLYAVSNGYVTAHDKTNLEEQARVDVEVLNEGGYYWIGW